MLLHKLTDVARSEGDPKVSHKGPGSLTSADKLARGLGWFSIALGVTELLAAGPLARSLGIPGKAGLIRGYGAREVMSGILTLSIDKHVGLAARIGGDALDLGTLATALHGGNPKRGNAALATALVVGVTLLDIVAYAGVKTVHRRKGSSGRDYSSRSGLPRGIQSSRGLARKDFRTPADYAAEGTVADALPGS